MIKKINAVGQTCPIPVIMTKNGLKEIEQGIIEVAVDNKISLENIQKFVKEIGYSFTTKEENNIFTISITKTLEPISTTSHLNNTVIVIGSDKLGIGDIILGETLMKGFIYTLTEYESLPKTILFYNRGIFLTTRNEDTIKDLKTLEEMGVEILSCGACLNFYHLENKLSVGSITNMYTILDKQMKADKVIKP